MNSFVRVTRHICVTLFVSACVFIARGAEIDTARIEAITGLKGAMNKDEGVFKVSAPRKDVSIQVDGWKMPPFMGLTSWAAFKSGGSAPAMVMGDFVLFEDEVNSVISTAQEKGLSVTALHNHFFFDQPKVFFMHIEGEGTAEDLAVGVKAMLDTEGKIRAAHPEPQKQFSAQAMPDKNAISVEPLQAILGGKPQQNSGMVKFVIGREVTMECGCPAAGEMGVNTWAAFAGADDNALVDGDFAVAEKELQPALKALRAGGINIVAIHHHMTGETPRILFFHYWGRGSAADLAKSLKAGLDAVALAAKAGEVPAK
ncbi:MAG TPA: DUF1259 domain-containing protein [Opitutaceae bacterium]|nr:DUF1259 domain-containing protein [Opitutaceae bacterium]